MRESAGFRLLLIRVLIYSALALVPVNMPMPESLPDPPHAIVQPTDGPDPDLDSLVASLMSVQ
jgi:hypothetical protein